MSAADSKDEREMAARARQVFNASIEDLDAATRSRLAQSRATAIRTARAGRDRAWARPSRLVPLGAAVAAVIAVALIWQRSDTRVAPVAPVGQVEAAVVDDLDILLAGEDLDLFEDLEFYTWLLEQPELLEAADGGDGSG